MMLGHSETVRKHISVATMSSVRASVRSEFKVVLERI